MSYPMSYVIVGRRSQFFEAEWRIYASVKPTTLASDNGLSPDRHQASIWTNAAILSITPKEHISVKFYLKFKSFHSWKCIWKCRLRNGGHFVSASMCQNNRYGYWNQWWPSSPVHGIVARSGTIYVVEVIIFHIWMIMKKPCGKAPGHDSSRRVSFFLHTTSCLSIANVISLNNSPAKCAILTYIVHTMTMCYVMWDMWWNIVITRVRRVIVYD